MKISRTDVDSAEFCCENVCSNLPLATPWQYLPDKQVRHASSAEEPERTIIILGSPRKRLGGYFTKDCSVAVLGGLQS